MIGASLSRIGGQTVRFPFSGALGGMCAHDVSYVVVFETTPSQLAAARGHMAGMGGVEPPRWESKSHVLPLDYIPL